MPSFLLSAIEMALLPIKGQSLLGIGRAANMATVTFGNPDVRSEDFFLHIVCPWRLDGESGIITGSSDLYEPVDPKNAVWTEHPSEYDTYPNLQDARLQEFHRDWEGKDQMAKVTSIEVDSLGGFRISLFERLQLSVFPAGCRGEYWRLFRRNDKVHFVVPPTDVYDNG